MKMFDWLNRKANKKNQAEIHATEIHHQQQQQQVKNPSLELHAALAAKSLAKLSSESKAAFQYFQEEQPKKRREIVKIFVNHEEYGLLAIGTLGLYELTEIELFEVKPQAQDHFQSLKSHKQEEKSKAPKEVCEEVLDKKAGAVVLHKDPAKKKKSFSLDPQFRSRLFHPFSHLNFISNSSRSNEAIHSIKSDHHSNNNAKDKTKNISLLKKLLVGKKQITNPTSSSREGQPTSKPSSSQACQSKLKKAMSQFSCMSVQVEQNSDDSDEDDEDGMIRSSTSNSTKAEADVVGALSSSTPDSSCSARGDPNAGHQQACARDMRPEYWIRTDSDYVVLEL